MAQRVAALEPRCYLEQEEGLLRLRHILNPELPLVVDTVVIDSPEGLAAAIQAGNKSFLWDLARQVVEGRVLAWFAATERGEAGARVLAALQNFTERYADRPHLAPYVVYWAIKQKASLPIGPGLRARKPEDLATILSQMITADCGGSNGNRVRLWHRELQKLADELQMNIQVMPSPPRNQQVEQN